LQWFRGKDCDVDDEMTKMVDALKEAQQNKGTMGDLLSSRGTVMALIVALGIMTFQQLSGVNAVIFYAGKIFQASGSSLSATTASIVIGVVQVHSLKQSRYRVPLTGANPHHRAQASVVQATPSRHSSVFL
jgi:SP family facilitated glucose transporter-like MFS transporter 8